MSAEGCVGSITDRALTGRGDEAGQDSLARRGRLVLGHATYPQPAAVSASVAVTPARWTPRRGSSTAINGRLEALRRNSPGFRNLINYRIRSLLHSRVGPSAEPPAREDPAMQAALDDLQATAEEMIAQSKRARK